MEKKQDMLVLKDIHKTYHPQAGPVEVLRGLHLRVPSGRAIAITGPSGSGKSTLLHLLAGLDTPDRGEVLLAGQDLLVLSPVELEQFRAKHIGILFQQHQLLQQCTALENILLPTLPLKVPGQIAKARAYELLERMKLFDRADHFPCQLSGGELHRVALARALMNQPNVLLADEPTGTLDHKTGEQIAEILKETSAMGHTLVVVTHAEYVAAIMDERYALLDGVLTPFPESRKTLTGECFGGTPHENSRR